MMTVICHAYPCFLSLFSCRFKAHCCWLLRSVHAALQSTTQERPSPNYTPPTMTTRNNINNNASSATVPAPSLRTVYINALSTSRPSSDRPDEAPAAGIPRTVSAPAANTVTPFAHIKHVASSDDDDDCHYYPRLVSLGLCRFTAAVKQCRTFTR